MRIPGIMRIAVAFAALVHGSAAADDWPGWRGAAGTGASTETGLPAAWSDTQNVAWKAALRGVGVSSPIVSRRPRLRHVADRQGVEPPRSASRSGRRCLGSPSGRSPRAAPSRRDDLLRRGVRPGERPPSVDLRAAGRRRRCPPVHDKHNLASAEPGHRWRNASTRGSAPDRWWRSMRAARQVWTRHLGKEFGPSTSTGATAVRRWFSADTLFLVCYHESASYLLAVDSRTGTHAMEGRSSERAHLLQHAARRARGRRATELVVNSSAGIDAYDPPPGGRSGTSTESNQFPIPVAMHHDGVIYMSRGYRSGPYMAIRPGGRGDISGSHVVWDVPTGAPYISSLVYYDGLLYMASDVGAVTHRRRNRASRWHERLGGIFSASPVAGRRQDLFASRVGRDEWCCGPRAASARAQQDRGRFSAYRHGDCPAGGSSSGRITRSSPSALRTAAFRDEARSST